MISLLRVRGFKRFEDHSFDLAKLTVLTGLNGSGKTSLIHALLLAWEASNGDGSTVRLNEPFGIELGSAEDVQNWNSKGGIEFDVESTGAPSANWRLGAKTDDSLFLTVEQRPEHPPVPFDGSARSFSYLSAERFGPRSVLGASPLPDDELVVGVRGEYCAQVLGALGGKPLEYSSRSHPELEDGGSSLLKYEVEGWLGQISRPIEIEATRYPGTAVTSMRFRSPGGEWVHAPNMGFGVSYALPVVLSGLIAKTGGLMVVENPEAHLHPAGQSRMGAFLGWLAGKGVQVVVETHSDHVLNGVRRAIGEYGYLSHTDAIAHFFDGDENGEPLIEKLEFSGVGGLSNWPAGFFDQYQIDVATLGRLRRRS